VTSNPPSTFIRGLTAAEVAEVWDIRRALELLAAESGVARATPSHRRDQSHCRQVGRKPRQRERGLRRIRRARSRFSPGLLQLADNRRLVDLYKGLHTDIINARLFYHGRARDWSATDAEHQPSYAPTSRRI